MGNVPKGYQDWRVRLSNEDAELIALAAKTVTDSSDLDVSPLAVLAQMVKYAMPKLRTELGLPPKEPVTVENFPDKLIEHLQKRAREDGFELTRR